MPFGKHAGKEVAKVPRGYLRWLRENATLREPLASYVEAAINRRPMKGDADAEDEVHRIVGEKQKQSCE